jgi:hypothetical protein
MRTVALPVPGSGLVEDVDLGPDGSSVAAVRAGTALRIVAGEWELESPGVVRFPRVRVIDAERVLIAATAVVIQRVHAARAGRMHFLRAARRHDTDREWS